MLGDPDELKAAVSNLVDNAIKYSNGQVHVSVELAAVDERRVAVRVRDQGIGISQAELKRIFRRFYRIPEAVAMRVKGTGLGLFIVSSVARKHGGRVFAESQGPGHGSTFTLQLPDGAARHEPHPRRRRRTAPRGRPAVQSRGRRPRRRGRRDRRGRARLALAREADPVDLVVLDVMLPGLDGFDVVRDCGRRGRYLPVLMLTARGRADDVLRGFAAGADDYLPKPFDLDDPHRARARRCCGA